MAGFFTRCISPKASYFEAQRLAPWFLMIALVAFIYGLYGALYAAPIDYQQGAVYRIIYIHVPCAILSMGLYVAMTVAAFIFLVWKIKVMDVFCEVVAIIGAVFTALTLITGSIWGAPTWGTWWVWDARLTSELLLLFIYLGMIALRHALVSRDGGAKMIALMICVGCINIPIIHYSVNWWQTLHQGATILRFGSPNIAPSMLHPLLAMILAFIMLACWWISIEFRAVLLFRRQHAQHKAVCVEQLVSKLSDARHQEVAS